MPIWLRNFTFNNIKEFLVNQQEMYENSQPSQKTNKEILRPDISPSYSTKASK